MPLWQGVYTALTPFLRFYVLRFYAFTPFYKSGNVSFIIILCGVKRPDSIVR